jgi:hypothetical protein
MDAELLRYVEYLQRGLLTRGFERAHDTGAFQHWVASHHAELIEMAQRSGGSAQTADELERHIARYTPRSAFDSVSASAIFEPILDRVLAAAQELNLAPERLVVFANSTDVSVSAAARPSSAEHLLFAGVGTYAFCNYWAKVLARIASALHRRFGGAPMTPARLMEIFSTHDALAREAIQLALYCKFTGTAVGYGVLEGSAETAPFRLEVLRAMETFVIAHEVGHCYFEERRERGHDLTALQEEAACDQYAWVVSRAIGNRDRSWIAFTGAGAYIFLRFATTCAPIRTTERADSDKTHPASKDRAEAIRAASIANTVEEQRAPVAAYLGDLDAIAEGIETAVLVLLKAAGAAS